LLRRRKQRHLLAHRQRSLTARRKCNTVALDRDQQRAAAIGPGFFDFAHSEPPSSPGLKRTPALARYR
jgi:hypothetical protein